MSLILWFSECSYKNKNQVGGKCSSLGELYNLSNELKFHIANGFALTTHFYDVFLEQNNITSIISNKLENINTDDINELETESEKLKNIIVNAQFTEEQENILDKYYKELCFMYNNNNLEVAIRSSAIAEDLPNASFAGQQDTYLNISGKDELYINIKRCFASLFNARAISYRKRYNIELEDVKISVAIQKMVRSDIGSAGVAFSIDPESGYDKAIIINSSFGLGELVVSGGVKPDEFILDKRVLQLVSDAVSDAVSDPIPDIIPNPISDPIIMKKIGDKQTKIIYANNGGTEEIETNQNEKLMFSLTDKQSIQLAQYILLLEEKYSIMFNKKIGIDVEWALDGIDQNIYIIQTRPETVHSQQNLNIKQYILDETGKVLLNGIAVGSKISSGKVKILSSIKEHAKFNKGDILVTSHTTPDWESIMRIASCIITDKGGRTCHSAIIARELGLNAIVGCGNATKILKDDDQITVSCADGEEGTVYEGTLKYHIEEMEVDKDLFNDISCNSNNVKLMLNIGNPEACFSNSLLPNCGVGLLRSEFTISNYIKIHPLALCAYPNIRDDIKDQIYNITGNYNCGKEYFIDRFTKGVGRIASAFYPNDVIVRLTDFKSNEYRDLIGGELYEPIEENSLLGIRGAIRYYLKDYEKSFELECEALKYVIETMHMDNIIIMIPFCRTTDECKIVIEKLASYGLVRGKNGLKIYIMCEIISNVIEADEFSQLIDGVSIGGNDLLMLTVGTDRDNEILSAIATDKNLSYRRLIKMAIDTYKKNGIKVGFCGNQVSSSIEFCQFLINTGIDSISVTSDVALKTMINIKNMEFI